MSQKYNYYFNMQKIKKDEIGKEAIYNLFKHFEVVL